MQLIENQYRIVGNQVLKEESRSRQKMKDLEGLVRRPEWESQRHIGSVLALQASFGRADFLILDSEILPKLTSRMIEVDARV